MSVRGEVYDKLKAEAAKQWCSVPELVAKILEPALNELEQDNGRSDVPDLR